MFTEVSELFVVSVKCCKCWWFLLGSSTKNLVVSCSCVLAQQKPDKIQMNSITKIKTSTKNSEFKQAPHLKKPGMACTRWKRSVKTWAWEGAPRNHFLTPFYLQISQFPYSLDIVCKYNSAVTQSTTFNWFHITLSALSLQYQYNYETTSTQPAHVYRTFESPAS